MAGIYNKIKCYKKDHPLFIPTEHQQKVLSYFPKSPYKGLILYHKLGSGKTCTSIMVADYMIKNKQIEHVYVLTPGSLRQNWFEEYCQKCGMDSEYLPKYFTFITYNFEIINKLKKLNFNNSLVIIDEIHNLINGIKNESKNAMAIYNKINFSNCRILALTGTPIFNNIDQEWYILGNLVKPNTFKKGKQITDDQLKGIVSYFPGIEGFYPEVRYKKPINLQLSGEQKGLYYISYKEESSLIRDGPPTEEDLRILGKKEYKEKKKEWMKAVKYTTTRKISNFIYPRIDYKKPDLLTQDGGWVNQEALANQALKRMSPKFTAFFLILMKHFNSKHVLYTFYKNKSGVILLHTLLKKCGIPAEIFSGDLNDKQREMLLKRYNSISNRNGEKIKVLLVTEAGAEGITLLEVNNFHILESSTREKKTTQAIGRVVRYKSHINMPKERQYVNIWRYWCGPLDEILYKKGLKKFEIIDQFLDKLIKNSIENNN